MDPSLLPFQAKRRRFEGEVAEATGDTSPEPADAEHIRATAPTEISLNRADRLDGHPPRTALQQRPWSGPSLWVCYTEGILEVYLSARQQAKRREVAWRSLSSFPRGKLSEAMKKEWNNIMALDALEAL